MSKMGKYVYGVMNSNTVEVFDLAGIVGLKDIYPLGKPEDVVNNSIVSNSVFKQPHFGLIDIRAIPVKILAVKLSSYGKGFTTKST